MYLAPIALAHSTLTEAEMRSGCLLVDLGAGTTTVSIYFKNILRQLAVIPLGGNNITKDITTLLIEDDEAEEMKIKYAKAFIEPSEINTEETLPVDAERSVPAKTFNELVEARMNEIIQNVWFGQMPPEYYNRLLGGIILTGGGSNMKDIKKAFTAITGIQRIRIAGTVSQRVTSTDKGINAHDGTMNTILGLLAKGDLNCAGPAIKPTTDLFETNTQTSTTTPKTPDTQRTSTHQTDKTGRVEFPEEKKRRERELNRADKPIQDMPSDTPRSGWFSRKNKFFQDFFTKIISAENEEDDKR